MPVRAGRPRSRMHDMNTTCPHASTEAPPQAVRPQQLRAHPAVEVVIPVHNEEHVLERSVRTLHAHLGSQLDVPFAITIADSASTDSTLARARTLARELPEVSVLHVDQKGRGRALRAAWGRSEADVVAYMDVDLSTGLDALEPLLAPLLQGRGDIAIGSRLAGAARGPRALRRPGGTQGGPPRGGAAAARGHGGRGLVLRHGAAAPGPAREALDPRGARALGRGQRLPRRHRGHDARRRRGSRC